MTSTFLAVPRVPLSGSGRGLLFTPLVIGLSIPSPKK